MHRRLDPIEVSLIIVGTLVLVAIVVAIILYSFNYVESAPG